MQINRIINRLIDLSNFIPEFGKLAVIAQNVQGQLGKAQDRVLTNVGGAEALRVVLV